MRTEDCDFIALVAAQGDPVSQADTLEDGAKLMKAVRPFARHIQNKI